ncbi:MAG: CspA family cold shock protein [Halioglobus sp.]|jgi:CspA family cold shock protein
MQLFAKVLVSLTVAVIVATVVSEIDSGDIFNLPLLLACAITGIASAMISNGSASATPSKPKKAAPKKAAKSSSAAGGNRDMGTVKWFNVSKGFGFITKDDGEEIFVHFRSIRGEGRRGLRDGQSVSFVVEQSDKGPQAEDVVAED